MCRKLPIEEPTPKYEAQAVAAKGKFISMTNKPNFKFTKVHKQEVQVGIINNNTSVTAIADTNANTNSDAKDEVKQCVINESAEVESVQPVSCNSFNNDEEYDLSLIAEAFNKICVEDLCISFK